jgi:hypothetical protein
MLVKLTSNLKQTPRKVSQRLQSWWDLAKWLERLTAKCRSRHSPVATVLGSIPASSDTVESEGRQMKQYWISYIKNKKNAKGCKACIGAASRYIVLYVLSSLFLGRHKGSKTLLVLRYDALQVQGVVPLMRIRLFKLILSKILRTSYRTSPFIGMRIEL